MLCLVDVNNFFASCERVFQPNLEGKPIVVLSNNDGCIIARSQEAKDIGIKMGSPYFEVKELLFKHKVYVFSSNYVLYSDMSSRVMAILKDFGIRQEVISVDESFLDLTGLADLTNHGQKIKTTIKQYSGLPVCVGIAKTKVLAKFANHLAKKYKTLNGVCNLEDFVESRIDKALQITPINDLWGIGRKLSKQLPLAGIKTAYDLKIANAKQISRLFSVNLEKMVYELNGIPCLELDDYHEPTRCILSSHSFGKPVTDINDLLSSVTFHLENATQKLRKQGLYARELTVFINTNRFNDDYYYNSTTIMLPQALDSFRALAKHLEPAIRKLYQLGRSYKKSGISLTSLITNDMKDIDLFESVNIQDDPLLTTIEQIRKKYGKSSINLASRNLADNWHMKREKMSQHYTTNLNELIEVK
jgi:DNA polymerase V